VKAAKKQGNVLSTVIGPVKFDLYGTEWMRVLEVNRRTQNNTAFAKLHLLRKTMN